MFVIVLQFFQHNVTLFCVQTANEGGIIIIITFKNKIRKELIIIITITVTTIMKTLAGLLL